MSEVEKHMNLFGEMQEHLSPVDQTKEDGISWDDWRAAFEDNYEQERRKHGDNFGYGPGPVMAKTGEDAWMDAYNDGFSPRDALEEDMRYWEGE